MNEFNAEAVAAAAAAELTRDFLAHTTQSLKHISKNLFEKSFPNFRKHLESSYLRNDSVKIITNRDIPVPFQSVYVQSFFKKGDDTLSDVEVADFVSQGNRSIVSAIGGAGKTFLMRFLWNRFFNLRNGRVPLFIELRKINAVSSVDLENFIRFTAFGADSFSEKTFSHFAEEGTFIFLLDGFDEVLKEKRTALEQQIVELSRKYPKSGFIVSGRPDDRFDGWQGFSTLKSRPLRYGQFVDLIGKVPFDGVTRNNFLKIADEGFFNKHSSFLSNPLLSLMMLLTYRDNAEIPNRICTFYENCFATLFSQHDALKESFRREKCLDQLEFKRIFSVFCLLSYKDAKNTFDGAEILSYIEKARDFTGLKRECAEILHDFLESVNLLIKEGMNYSFIHRSFQEYFSAFCVTGVLSHGVSEILAIFCSRQGDQTLRLAYEMHPALVEREFIFPIYDRLKESGRIVSRRDSSLPFKALSAASFHCGAVIVPLKKLKGAKTRKFELGLRIVTHELSADSESLLFSAHSAYDDPGFLEISFSLYRTATSLFHSCLLTRGKGRSYLNSLLELGNASISISASGPAAVVSVSSSTDSTLPSNEEFNSWMAQRVEKVLSDAELQLTQAHRRINNFIEERKCISQRNAKLFP